MRGPWPLLFTGQLRKQPTSVGVKHTIQVRSTGHREMEQHTGKGRFGKLQRPTIRHRSHNTDCTHTKRADVRNVPCGEGRIRVLTYNVKNLSTHHDTELVVWLQILRQERRCPDAVMVQETLAGRRRPRQRRLTCYLLGHQCQAL